MDGVKQGVDGVKQGVDGVKQGVDGVKQGVDWVKRIGLVGLTGIRQAHPPSCQPARSLFTINSSLFTIHYPPPVTCQLRM